MVKNINSEEYIDYLLNTNKLPNNYIDKFKFIQVFYENSLNDDLAKNLKPAIFIDIDCDIYTSTIQVLDFIF
jgi:hypothetical protein